MNIDLYNVIINKKYENIDSIAFSYCKDSINNYIEYCEENGEDLGKTIYINLELDDSKEFINAIIKAMRKFGYNKYNLELKYKVIEFTK